jgi:hypothetical protein
MRKEAFIVFIAAGLGTMLAIPAQAPPAEMTSLQTAWFDAPAIAAAGPCLPLDCASVSVAPPPGFDYPLPSDLVPDRRPVIKVGMFGGFCAFPPEGLPGWWVDLDDLDGNGVVDSVDALLGKLDDAYGNGWRRMEIQLPAGSYPGLMASSQWWTMPQEKRDSLALALPAWLADHPDATLGLYAGFMIADPCQLCMSGCVTCYQDCGAGGDPCALCPECAGTAAAQYPLTTNAQDMCVVYQNVEPWIDAGLQEIWFDFSGGASPSRMEAMLRLAGNPDYAGRIKFGSEPIAVEYQGGGAYEPVMDAVERLAFVSHRRYYEIVSTGASPEAWVLDPATTEVHVIFREDAFCVDQVPGDGNPCTDCPDWCEGVPDPPSIDVVFDYVQRGYIPYARGVQSDEYVRRIFDMNTETIPCPMDLDGDGDVDGDDADRAAFNIGMATGATLYHGDVDFDDDVDVIDYFLIVGQPGFPGPCP